MQSEELNCVFKKLTKEIQLECVVDEENKKFEGFFGRQKLVATLQLGTHGNWILKVRWLDAPPGLPEICDCTWQKLARVIISQWLFINTSP